MSRTTARSRRARPAASTQATAHSGPSLGAEPTQDTWQRSLDISRVMLGATLGNSQAWMRGLGDWQEAQASSLRQASERIQQWAGEAETAPDWPTLWALQADLAGAQWTQAMQGCSGLIEQAMQIEARLVERSRADATRLSQRWMADLNGGGGGGGDAPECVEANAPLAMIGQAQATMNEMSRLWTQAFYNTSLPD